MTSREDARLFERYCRDRDEATRERLITRFLGLAHHLALRYEQGRERDDVFQVATIGLIKAVDRYDPDRGVAFSSFAVPTILGEIKRYFRDLGWTVRVPRDVQELSLRLERKGASLALELGRDPTAQELAERCDASVEAVLEARGSSTAHRAISLDQPARDDDGLLAYEHGFDGVDDDDEFDRRLGTLSAPEQRVMQLRFRHELLQREIAEVLGMSQMQVSRLIAHSLETLRAAA